MLKADDSLKPEDLKPKFDDFWKLSGEKIRLIEKQCNSLKASPVFTEAGKYAARGWTDWTQGFRVGSALLQFDAVGDEEFLEPGRRKTVEEMAGHVTHAGVHDHGFNNISTYGNLLRMMEQGVIPEREWERNFYELALKASGAVQANRWSTVSTGGGYVYSFNGPHSLFADTIRSLRSLSAAHLLGHVLYGENDANISLLERMCEHVRTTSEYIVYYGEGRDSYDIRGRTAHEAIFNRNDGCFRCPSTQQGYSAFSTWTRGLAWIMLGSVEELEFLNSLKEDEMISSTKETLLKMAKATCDFYLENMPSDGIPYWDTGAPGLVNIPDYLDKPADSFNDYEPVDSSAAAIGVQGLLRLGNLLGREKGMEGYKYWQAGVTVLNRLLEEPYLSTDSNHQGLLLHSIYHRPNGWDFIPEGSKIPRGESCMWGDYHIREAVLYAEKIRKSKPYYAFYDIGKDR